MPDGRARPLWRWLVILVLATWATGAALAPSQAQPPCLGTEDGRCLPWPASADHGLTLSAQSVDARIDAQAEPEGPIALVRRRDAVSPARFAALLQDRGHTARQGLAVRGWWRVSPAPGESMEELLARLRAMPEVAYAEEDGLVQATYLPDDTYLQHQWALSTVEAPLGWDRTMGSSEVWIAVVDTGVDAAHPDAPETLWAGYDFANDDADPADDHGHGTHVAGITAAATDNALGVAGLCPGCEVLAIKVLDKHGSGLFSDVAEGITYAAQAGHAAGKRIIINLSLGGGYSYAVHQAVAQAQEDYGALVVAAAGNDGPMAPDYPARLSGVLAVAATDENDVPAYFSQYGDIAAPGVSILSTVPTWYDDPPYQFWNGTSMASPLVAGAAGLVWSLEPSLSATEVGARLLASVDVPTGWNPNFGAGRLNVAQSLSPDPTATPTSTSTATPTSTPTSTSTATPTSTSTSTPTPTSTSTPTPTFTSTSTPTPTSTSTPTPTSSSTPEPSPTFTGTPEPSPTFTGTPEPSPTFTGTPESSPTLTGTPEPSPTFTGTPEPSPTFTGTPESSPTITGTPEPSPTLTDVPVPTPTATHTPAAPGDGGDDPTATPTDIAEPTATTPVASQPGDPAGPYILRLPLAMVSR